VKLKIKIDEKTYEVDVEASEPETAPLPFGGYSVAPAAVRVPAGPAAPAPVSEGPVNEEKVCRSPVSGMVVRVQTQVGQSIQAGDVLLVLEAMKMETNITAPGAGKVAAIKVNAGEAVSSGQVVVELE
jgi:methylmalonyl-CoA carboxyltransferase small subunit